MPLKMMPYIEFATENYINAKFNLARSDVNGPELENLLDMDRVFQLMKKDSYSLMKILRSKLASIYSVPDYNIEFTIGVTNSFFTISHIMKNLGHGRVICESPGYEPFWLTPQGCGLDVIFLERSTNDYTIDLEKLEEISKEGDWLWISNPHNPSGKYLTIKEISEIAQVLKKKNCFLFVDEIYHDFVTPLGEDSAISQESNVVISSSFTKTYGLGGQKVGWIIGPKIIIEQATILRLHQFMLIPSPSLSLLIPFMDEREKVRTKSILHVKNNLEFLKSLAPETKMMLPKEGPIGLYKLNNGINDIDFSISCSRQYGLVVAPGSFFLKPGFLRLSWAGDNDSFKESIKLLQSIEKK